MGTSSNVVIIGCGCIGGALVRGLAAAGRVAPSELIACDHHDDKLKDLERRCGCRTTRSAVEAAQQAAVAFIAVKPRALPELLPALAPVLRPGTLVISTVAGARTTEFEAALGSAIPVVRSMPNLPAVIGAGATAITAGAHATEEHMQLAESLLSAVGRVARVEEDLMNAVTGLSGSAPAYVFLMIEALIDGGIKVGIPRGICRELVVQTVLGSARMLQTDDRHPAMLRDMVTTPGGTTISAIHELESRSVRSAFIHAVEVATERAAQLTAPKP
ncbi:MAG TPA: pyrroline-5-carboxylate reductase [Acidobacteriota bacterium]